MKKKTKKLTSGGDDGQLVALKPAKKKAVVPIPEHSIPLISQSPAEKKKKPVKAEKVMKPAVATNQDIVSATVGPKKPRKKKAAEETSGTGFQQEMQGEIGYTIKVLINYYQI